MTGLDYLLPHRVEPDAAMVRQSWLLASGEPWDFTNEGISKYPILIPALGVLASPYLDQRAHAFASTPSRGLRDRTEDWLAAAVAPVLGVRWIVALFGALLVPATFLLARRFLEPAWALVAAGGSLVSFLGQVFSSQARGHGAIATLSIVAVLAAMRLRRRPTLGCYLMAGAAAALALSCLHSGAAVLPAVLVAVLFRTRESSSRQVLSLGIGGVVFLALVAVGYTPILATLGDTYGVKLVSGELHQSGHRMRFSDFNGGGLRVVVDTLIGYEPFLTVFAAIGLGFLVVATLRGEHRGWWRGDAGVAAAHAVTYALAIGAYAATYPRFVTPLVPYLALCAACACRRLWLWAGNGARLRRTRYALATVGVLTCYAPSALAVAKLARLRSAPDTVELAATWVREHVERRSETVAVSTGLMLPLVSMPRTMARASSDESWVRHLWPNFQRSMPIEVRRSVGYRIIEIPWIMERVSVQHDSDRVVEFLNESGAEYALIFVDSTRFARAGGRRVRRAAHRWGQRVARIPREAEAIGRLGLEHQDTPNMFWRVLREGTLGPAIEIYQRSSSPP